MHRQDWTEDFMDIYIISAADSIRKRN